MNSSNKKNIIKGIDYLIQSSNNGNINANFLVGYFYQEGEYVDRDIKKSIRHYKEASSFNNQYAKNNLGIIYKYGIDIDNENENENEKEPKIGSAIEYFKEAIKKKNDKVSMYNLSHIYIYEEMNEQIDESIELLINSSNEGFSDSKFLLCIALIKKYGFNIEQIRSELNIKTKYKSEFANDIYLIIQNNNLLEESIYEYFYEQYKTIDFLYCYFDEVIISKHILEKTNENKSDYNNEYNLTHDFYEGFDIS